jgi:hypothetical protein
MSEVSLNGINDMLAEKSNEVKEEAVETSTTGTEMDSQSIESVEDDVKQEDNPYKAELEKVQESLERERETRKYERGKRKEYQKENEELRSSTSDESFDMESKIASMLDEKLNPILQKVDQDKLDSQISKVTDDPHKAELVKYHLENSVRRTGSLQEDIKKAEILADSVAYKNDIEKKVRKSEAKKFAAKGGLKGGGRPQNFEEKKTLSAGQANILKHFRNINQK